MLPCSVHIPHKAFPARIERAENAVRMAGGIPSSEPVRGGTDGAILSSKGLPCPNLSTGGYNYHSRYEFASVPEMEKSLKVLILLAQPDN